MKNYCGTVFKCSWLNDYKVLYMGLITPDICPLCESYI